MPTHQQLLLPLLEALDDLGGSAPARTVSEVVAERLNIPEELRRLTEPADRGRPVNLLRRRVRWVRQSALQRGFVSGERRGVWSLTERGRNTLLNVRPGIAIVVYETERGVALWADAHSAAAVIEDDSVNLILTSPPYPLSTPKQFGNLGGPAYLDWLVSLAAEWKRMLVDDGSLVLNVADVWERGRPTLSLYQERLLIRLVDELGFHLAQRFYWSNPAKLPSSHWVTIKRVRVKSQVEHCLWLSKTPWPDADNRRVLRAYTERQQRLIAAGGEYRRLRPCGHGNSRGAFGRDNGGSIPPNLIEATNAVSNGEYMRRCREAGLPIHPARFPADLPNFFVRLLTREGGRVYDPFFGSGTTGRVCEELGREWLGSERSLAYLRGSLFQVPGVRRVASGLRERGGGAQEVA